MSNYAVEAEKQSASVFKWIINDDQFITKTGISNRNLTINDKNIETDSNVKNVGRYLTEKLPKSVDTSIASSSQIDFAPFTIKSEQLNSTLSHQKTGAYYGFQAQHGLNEDRVMNKSRPGTDTTEVSYKRELGYPIPKLLGSLASGSSKTQNVENVIEPVAIQRGGLSTRNYVKDKGITA
jgi:hypothetical protein|tara:strand:+ start:1455 stop:1994 length:540 start_codon:yes stop_codon:yes gene_type:complete